MIEVLESLYVWIVNHVETALVAMFVVIREMVIKKRMLNFEKKINLDVKKKEHEYRVSHESLNNLFNKKISVYEDLLLILSAYEIKINETSQTYFAEDNYYRSGGHLDLHSQEYYKLSIQIKDLIAPNRLVVSEELLKSYDDLYKIQIPYFHRHNYSGEEGFDVDDFNSLYKELESKTKSKMILFIEKIKCDEKLIRSHIDMLIK